MVGFDVFQTIRVRVRGCCYPITNGRSGKACFVMVEDETIIKPLKLLVPESQCFTRPLKRQSRCGKVIVTSLAARNKIDRIIQINRPIYAGWQDPPIAVPFKASGTANTPVRDLEGDVVDSPVALLAAGVYVNG